MVKYLLWSVVLYGLLSFMISCPSWSGVYNNQVSVMVRCPLWPSWPGVLYGQVSFIGRCSLLPVFCASKPRQNKEHTECVTRCPLLSDTPHTSLNMKT